MTSSFCKTSMISAAPSSYLDSCSIVTSFCISFPMIAFKLSIESLWLTFKSFSRFYLWLVVIHRHFHHNPSLFYLVCRGPPPIPFSLQYVLVDYASWLCRQVNCSLRWVLLRVHHEVVRSSFSVPRFLSIAVGSVVNIVTVLFVRWFIQLCRFIDSDCFITILWPHC